MTDEELRANLHRTIVIHGVGHVGNQVFHGWRCQYPESYGNGPCDCVDRFLDDLVKASKGDMSFDLAREPDASV